MYDCAALGGEIMQGSSEGGFRMQQFILEQNIANFIHRLREVDTVAERDVLCQLIITEIDHSQSKGQLEFIDRCILNVERDMGALADGKADGTAQVNLWELLRLVKRLQRRLKANSELSARDQ